MCISWRRCTSGSLAIQHSSVVFYWVCVYGDETSAQMIPSPLLITGFVVVLYIPSYGISTCTRFSLYIVIYRYAICVTQSYWYQIPTYFLYRWPDCGWRKKLNFMWIGCIHFPSCTGCVNPVSVVLQSMVLHYSLFVFHFHLIAFVDSPIAVIP